MVLTCLMKLASFNAVRMVVGRALRGGRSSRASSSTGPPRLRQPCPPIQETRRVRLLWGRICKLCQDFVKISLNFSEIVIYFCIQSSIFQQFSKSTNFCKILQKILQNFADFWNICRFLQNFPKKCQKFCIFFRNPQKFSNILQNFLQNFTEICRFWKMLKNAILDAKIYGNFVNIWWFFDKFC